MRSRALITLAVAALLAWRLIATRRARADAEWEAEIASAIAEGRAAVTA